MLECVKHDKLENQLKRGSGSTTSSGRRRGKMSGSTHASGRTREVEIGKFPSTKQGSFDPVKGAKEPTFDQCVGAKEDQYKYQPLSFFIISQTLTVPKRSQTILNTKEGVFALLFHNLTHLQHLNKNPRCVHNPKSFKSILIRFHLTLIVRIYSKGVFMIKNLLNIFLNQNMIINIGFHNE